ncbi:hypothetical protein [Collimonas sp. OK307]|uniref:hypothetical protein n=1 Tax=Collimonas sp. OK307 TaxID=1801620 RepID=UPI001587DF81|nr:hypothetical protein [Collimonas sp. OK307]
MAPPGKLMLAVVGKMDCGLLVERIQVGHIQVKARGKTFGRPPKTTVARCQAMIHG